MENYKVNRFEMQVGEIPLVVYRPEGYFEKYKTISINKSTFESLSTNPHFYFIDTEPEMLT